MSEPVRSAMQTFRAVRIDAQGQQIDRAEPLAVRASTFELAADRVMEACIEAGTFDVRALPLDIIVRDATNDARRFRCELITVELNTCKVCGCTDDRACSPPCSWVDDDLCSTPACVEAAGARA